MNFAQVSSRSISAMNSFLRKTKKPDGKILIARTDNLGDFIQCIPSFHRLAEKFPGQFAVLCSAPQDQLLKHDPFIPEIITVDKKNIRNSLEQIRRRNFKVLVNLVEDNLMKNLLPLLRFIPMRIGNLSNPKSFFFYNYPRMQKRSQSIKNEAEYNAELLSGIEVSSANLSKPKIFIAPEEMDLIRQKLKILKIPIHSKTLALHCGMNGSALNWPDKKYRELIEILSKEGRNILLTGGNLKEWQKNEEFTQYGSTVHNLGNLFSLREFAALLSLVPQTIAPSTGVLHLASAVGSKIYGIYPPIQTQKPLRWQPYKNQGKMFSPEVECPAKYRCLKDKCRFYDCMHLISPEKIAEEILGYSIPSHYPTK